MKTIPLTQGQVAKVSDEWYEELSKYKWCAQYKPHAKSFYAVRNSGQKRIYMHRVIANTPSGIQVDHIDHDTLNNQPENLRNCTVSQNMCNQRKRTDNTSGFKGVDTLGKKWRARIQIKASKRIYLGTYPTLEEAAHAYDEAAKKYHGEFANSNKLD